MQIYNYTNYKKYVVDRLAMMPNGGRGQLTKISEAIGIHTSLATHIFRGEKDLSADQAFALADFFGLDANETEYLVTLVNSERAGRHDYKAYLALKLEALKAKAVGRVKGDHETAEFDDVKQQIFYSQWFYAAIHLLTTLPGFDNVDQISERIGLTPQMTKGALDFLVSAGLCACKNGIYTARKMQTKIKNQKTLSIAHNTNWRYKAVERLSQQTAKDLFYNNLVSISEKDAQKIREILEKTKSDVMKVVLNSPAETIYCLNLDWCQI